MAHAARKVLIIAVFLACTLGLLLYVTTGRSICRTRRECSTRKKPDAEYGSRLSIEASRGGSPTQSLELR